MYTKWFAAPILCLCLSIPAAFADAELEVKEIVVTATRTEEEILTAPGHVTVLGEEEISRSGARNLADLLTRQAGIKVNDYGAEGAQKIISIRGSSSSQVLILVNGVRQNDSNSGGADLASIPLDNIERIEIIRGGFSSLYGADAVGGVINIITKRNADGRLKVKVENGTYIPRDAIEVSEGPTETPVDANLLDLVDTQKVTLEYSTKIGDSDLVVMARGTRAANNFVWNDEEYINDYRARINADLLGGGGYVSLSAPAGDGTVGANASLSYQDVGTPGSIDPSWASSDARQKNLSAMAQMFFETDRFLTDLFSLDAQAYYKFVRLTYENPPADANISDLHSFGLDAVQEFTVLDRVSLVYGANVLFDLVDNTSYNKNRFSGGVFVELPLYPLLQLSIIPVLRYDYYSDFPGSFNFKLSSVYALNESIALKLSGGSSYRAPTFSDLYYPDDGFYVGNPDVKPEKAYYAELGATVATGGGYLNAFAFARYLIDGILWVFNSGIGRYEPTNINKIFYPGFEMNAEVNLWSDLWLTGAYTLIYSFILEDDTTSYTFADDKRAYNTPVHTADASLEYRGADLTAGVSAEYVGEMETVYSGTLEDYFVLNALLRYRVSKFLTLQAAVDNILNSAYEVLGDYIAPPVSLWLGAELTL
jgi:vitamin B12 transporter